MRVAARAADERGRDGRRVAPAHGLARVTGGADSGTAGARVERAAAEWARRAIRIAAHDLAAGCAPSRGIGVVGTESFDGKGFPMVYLYLFGAGAEEAIRREEADWREWIERTFDPAKSI